MLKKAITTVAGSQSWYNLTRRHSSVVSTDVNAMLLRFLKDNYLKVSEMPPPPKVSPPEEFTILKGALVSKGPVLKRIYKNEEINITVMRLANLAAVEDNYDDEFEINQLFLRIDISKPRVKDSLQFLCEMHPDALGIRSVAFGLKVSEEGLVVNHDEYTGPMFENLDEDIRDALHDYIEERGINESLFPFLQAWLYVKDHHNLMHWFKTVGSYINEHEMAKEAEDAGDSMVVEGA